MKRSELQTGDLVLVRPSENLSRAYHARIETLPDSPKEPILVRRQMNAVDGRYAKHPLLVWPDDILRLLRRKGIPV